MKALHIALFNEDVEYYNLFDSLDLSTLWLFPSWTGTYGEDHIGDTQNNQIVTGKSSVLVDILLADQCGDATLCADAMDHINRRRLESLRYDRRGGSQWLTGMVGAGSRGMRTGDLVVDVFHLLPLKLMAMGYQADCREALKILKSSRSRWEHSYIAGYEGVGHLIEERFYEVLSELQSRSVLQIPDITTFKDIVVWCLRKKNGTGIEGWKMLEVKADLLLSQEEQSGNVRLLAVLCLAVMNEKSGLLKMNMSANIKIIKKKGRSAYTHDVVATLSCAVSVCEKMNRLIMLDVVAAERMAAFLAFYAVIKEEPFYKQYCIPKGYHYETNI